jgi:hypothetical protein
MMNQKEWREVTTNPQYAVSEDGDVVNLLTGHILSPWIVSGYPRIKLYSGDTRYRWHRVPRLVCAAWHGPPPTKAHEVRHLDGNPGNNHYSNLAWGTRSENMLDARRHGTLQRRLSDSDVVDIKRFYVLGQSVTALAERFGVYKSSICKVLDGQSHAALVTRYDDYVARLRADIVRPVRHAHQ